MKCNTSQTNQNQRLEQPGPRKQSVGGPLAGGCGPRLALCSLVQSNRRGYAVPPRHSDANVQQLASDCPTCGRADEQGASRYAGPSHAGRSYDVQGLFTITCFRTKLITQINQPKTLEAIPPQGIAFHGLTQLK